MIDHCLEFRGNNHKQHIGTIFFFQAIGFRQHLNQACVVLSRLDIYKVVTLSLYSELFFADLMKVSSLRINR